MRRAFAFLLALWPAVAPAATTINKGGWQGLAVTTASQQIIGPASVLPVPVNAVQSFLYLENEGAGTICLSFGAPATITGGACAAGEIVLNGAGAFRMFDLAVPADAVYAIGSGATTLTVGAQ